MDSIVVREFVSQPGEVLAHENGSERYDLFSPNGSRFLVVSSQGDLAEDGVIGELHVFSVRDVVTALAQGARRCDPVRTLRRISLASEAPYMPIDGAFWQDDDTIVFASTHHKGERGLYRFHVDVGQLEPLTGDRQAVPGNAFDISAGTTVYAAESVLDRSEQGWMIGEYPESSVAQSGLVGLLAQQRFADFQLFVSDSKQLARPLPLVLDKNGFILGIWVSPNGQRAIASVAPKDLKAPAAWSHYEQKPSTAYNRFMLLDLQAGTAVPVMDAPVGLSVTTIGKNPSLGDRRRPYVNAFWSADSSRVLLVNTALPPSENLEERRRMSYLVDYSVSDGTWSMLEPLEAPTGRVSSVEWLVTGKSVLVSHTSSDGSPTDATVYVFQNGRWISSDAKSAAPSHIAPKREPAATLAISVRQDSDNPPRLVVSRAEREMTLLDQDSSLANVHIAPMKNVQWRQADGTIIQGGLIMPRDSLGMTPPPLVIQAYHYQPHLFRPDGSHASAYAAQALAAQGMAVLHMDITNSSAANAGSPNAGVRSWVEVSESPREAEYFIDNVAAAVKTLGESGQIDGTRVGMVGWSRGGILISYSLLHPERVKLAAAIIDDSDPMSYGSYVIDVATEVDTRAAQTASAVAAFHGGGTFWQNKFGWLERMPLFNTDKVRTPTLFAAHLGGAMGRAAYAAETIGAWRINHLPFDYLIFPEGGHILRRPRERLAAMQATVDWMNFWLQDGAPSDPDRRARWERLRADWQATQQAQRGDEAPWQSVSSP